VLIHVLQDMVLLLGRMPCQHNAGPLTPMHCRYATPVLTAHLHGLQASGVKGCLVAAAVVWQVVVLGQQQPAQTRGLWPLVGAAHCV
jgi:hypothetical protein